MNDCLHLAMSIQALSVSAVRAIGSSQALTDPAAAIKELIDNALDANASTISVELSSNTLDRIHVRDNGHGIAPEDREMACRRYCTSKIRQYSNVRAIGGNFLGFRGEALASAAELSRKIILITRVEGEEIAEMLHINRQGEIEGERTSQPVGTSVRLTDLLSPLPVRKETALKSSSKCLAKIKKLMQAYALARPHTRFSLKVLETKNGKDNWIYASKANGTVEDAVIKVVGMDCARDCRWSVMKKDNYEIQAFLPTPECSSANVGNIGHFLSIDSRPVSASRGMLKQIVSAFRHRLKASNPNLGNLRDPFLWMNIVCPAESYDVNIEPAKDDVIFDDGDKVLQAVQALLDQCYPPLIPPSSPALPQASSGSVLDSETHGMIALEDHPVPNIQKAHEQHKRWASNMYSDADEDLPEYLDHTSCRTETGVDEGGDSEIRNVNISNPWTMAKMHASNRRGPAGSSIRGQLLTPSREVNPLEVFPVTIPGSIPLPPYPPWITPASSSSPLERMSAVDESDSEAESPFRKCKRARNLQSDCGVVETVADSPPEDASRDTNLRPLTNRRWRDWSSLRASANFASSTSSYSGPPSPTSSPVQLPTPSQSRNGATTKPFISPVSKKPRNRPDADKAYCSPYKRSQRSEQTSSKSLETRTGFFAPRQSDARATRHGTPTTEMARPPSPNGRRESPLEIPSSNNGIHNTIITIRTSIATLSTLIAASEVLSLALNSTNEGYGDIYALPWSIPSDNGFRVQPDGEQDAPSLLLEPPVQTWEMEKWSSRILRYRAVACAGRGGAGEMIDIMAAVRGHVAGMRCV